MLVSLDTLAYTHSVRCHNCRHMGKGGHALPPATQTYLPHAQRLQRDLGRQAVDMATDLAALQAMQAAVGAPGAAAEEVAASLERARFEAMNVGSAFATFQQLSADLNAGLDATQQLEAEVQHLLLQVSWAEGIRVVLSA